MGRGLLSVVAVALLIGCSDDPSAPDHHQLQSRPIMPASLVVGSFTLTELGTLGGTQSFGNAINAAGDVVGQSALASGNDHATIWPAGEPAHDLGTLGGLYSAALGINDEGAVVGYSNTADNTTQHAVLWPADRGAPRDLGTLGGSYSYAYDINSAGDVVGYSQTLSGNQHATLWRNGGVPVDLGGLGGSNSVAFGINQHGDIVGYGDLPNGDFHATRWPTGGGAPVDLGTLGGRFSYAYDINISGDIVGASDLGDGRVHAVLWPAGGGLPIDLGALGGDVSVATGINDAGDVVGFSLHSASGGYHTTLWPADRSGPRDLGTLGGSESLGWDINASGRVSGQSQLSSGQTRATLWTPLAQPQAPVADAGTAQSGSEGATLTFDASASFDPDGDALVSYAWDFGDGSTKTVTRATVEHTYSDNNPAGGAYSVTLRVTDASGAVSATATTSALIQNLTPTATFSPAGPVGEGAVTLSLTDARDAAGDLGTLQYAFDCGDGTGYGPFSLSSSAACSLVDNGTWNVRARIKDKDGAMSEYSRGLAVTNVAPSIAIVSAPTSGKVGIDYALQFKFTDPGTRDAPWYYQTSWGDGKKASAANAATTQGLTITQTHRYGSPGTYTVTVRVTDKNGGTATASVTVNIVR